MIARGSYLTRYRNEQKFKDFDTKEGKGTALYTGEVFHVRSAMRAQTTGKAQTRLVVKTTASQWVNSRQLHAPGHVKGLLWTKHMLISDSKFSREFRI